jgi:hypothetical protein
MANEEGVKIVISAEDRFSETIKRIEASSKLFGETTKNTQKHLEALEKEMVRLVANGLDPADKKIKEMMASYNKLAQSLDSGDSSLKKSNQQWTNLALVVQDLPYGFRGIQNNLPALMGGIAGVAGPLYLVGSAVIALFTAWDAGLFKVKNSTNALNDAQKDYNETLKSSMGSSSEEIAKMNALVSIASNHEISMQKRLIAVKKLQDEYPLYFGNLDKEKILNGNVATAVDGVKTSIIERAKATAIASKINKLSAEKFAKDEELYQLALQKTARIQAAVNFVKAFPSSAKNLKGLIDASVGGIREQENKIKSFVDVIDRELKRLQGLYTESASQSIGLDAEPLKKAKTKVDKLAARIAKGVALAGGNIEPITEPLLKQTKGNLDEQIKILDETSKRRIGIIKEQYQTEVSLADGSFEKIKQAQANMRVKLDEEFKAGLIGTVQYSKAIQDLIQQQNDTIYQQAKANFENLLQLGNGIMSALGPSLDMLIDKGASLGDVLTSAFQDLLKQLAKVIISAGIAVLLLSAIGLAKPTEAFKLFGSLVSQGMGLGKNLFETKKFADGGIVSGPTYGLMGEYPGAKHNPEVVAPLDKLKSMIGGGGNGEFVLRGNDLVLALQRSNSSLTLRR